jgi:uncharacterized protein (TIGR02271 family)
MAYEKIVAFYDKADKARNAAHALEDSGFSSSDIGVLNRGSVSDREFRDGGWWQRLIGRSVSDQEGAVYRRTLESGGGVLTLRTPDTEVDRAMKILNGHGPMDLHDRTTTVERATDRVTSTVDRATDRVTSTVDRATDRPTSTLTTTTPPVGPVRTVAGEEVLRLAEEQLDVGKRQVATGKSRIRRFVVEKPVQSQVTLHEEHCEVARRAVTDPTLAKDVDWKDQVIEVTETSEQPVVSKTARVAEEVVIRRRGSDHVETVRDTVRRQQIEVERVPDVNVKKAA